MLNEKIIEAILFVSGEPVSIGNIAEALQISKSEAQDAAESLIKRYAETEAGIQVLEIDGCYQMCTNPLCFDTVQKLYEKPKKKPLTQTLMETLSIIAFKQPVTRTQIEEIRGVSADHAVNRLLELNLIEEQGRLDIPGKPIAFGTTLDFLRYFGLKNVEELSGFADNQTPESEQIMLEDGQA